jgi:hypothetical protein
MNEASCSVLVGVPNYSNCGGDSENDGTWLYTNMPQTNREVVREVMAQKYSPMLDAGARCKLTKRINKLILLDCMHFEICHWHPFRRNPEGNFRWRKVVSLRWWEA